METSLWGNVDPIVLRGIEKFARPVAPIDRVVRWRAAQRLHQPSKEVFTLSGIWHKQVRSSVLLTSAPPDTPFVSDTGVCHRHVDLITVAPWR